MPDTQLTPKLVFCHCGKHGRIEWSNGSTGVEMIAKDSAVEILHGAVRLVLTPSQIHEFTEMILSSALPTRLQDLDQTTKNRFGEFVLMRIKLDSGLSPMDPHEYIFSETPPHEPNLIFPEKEKGRAN